MRLARQHQTANDMAARFRHRERAHSLGQRHCLPHLRSHYRMSKAGLRSRNWREALGRIPRMPASVSSLIGTVPSGLPALRPMPIPADLQSYLSERVNP